MSPSLPLDSSRGHNGADFLKRCPGSALPLGGSGDPVWPQHRRVDCCTSYCSSTSGNHSGIFCLAIFNCCSCKQSALHGHLGTHWSNPSPEPKSSLQISKKLSSTLVGLQDEVMKFLNLSGVWKSFPSPREVLCTQGYQGFGRSTRHVPAALPAKPESGQSEATWG